jgi:hypothetical protein
MNAVLGNAVEELINQIAVEVAKAVSQRLSPMMKPPSSRPLEIPVSPKTEIVSKILTETDVQREYGLSKAWLRQKRLFREGLPFLKIGKMVRYRREDIEKFLAERYCCQRNRPTQKN